MLHLSRKTDYALVALAFLGKQQAQGETVISAKRIASRLSLPLALLMNLLKQLVHAHLVTSTRGSRGGYTLAGHPQRITLMEVITAIDGPIRLTPCSDGLPIVGQGCQIACGCPIRQPIRKLHERINGLLEQVTLADLLDSQDQTTNEPSVTTKERLKLCL